MLTLIIREKGHFIEIPGLPPFRTPVEANISHISMHLVVSKLQAQGIKKFEIVSDTKGKERVLTQRDFNVSKKSDREDKKKKNYEERFNKLETLLGKLLENQVSEPSQNKEQITNKLSSIEKLLKKKQKTKVVHVTDKKTTAKEKEPVVEELEDTFIPEIDLDGMHMKGKASKKTVKQDKNDIDDSADLLSRIMQED